MRRSPDSGAPANGPSSANGRSPRVSSAASLQRVSLGTIGRRPRRPRSRAMNSDDHARASSSNSPEVWTRRPSATRSRCARPRKCGSIYDPKVKLPLRGRRFQPRTPPRRHQRSRSSSAPAAPSTSPAAEPEHLFAQQLAFVQSGVDSEIVWAPLHGRGPRHRGLAVHRPAPPQLRGESLPPSLQDETPRRAAHQTAPSPALTASRHPA